MLWNNKIFDLKYYLVLRVLFPEEIDRHYYSQLPVVRPLGCSGCCIRWRVDVFVPAFVAAISGHVGV